MLRKLAKKILLNAQGQNTFVWYGELAESVISGTSSFSQVMLAGGVAMTEADRRTESPRATTRDLRRWTNSGGWLRAIDSLLSESRLVAELMNPPMLKATVGRCQ